MHYFFFYYGCAFHFHNLHLIPELHVHFEFTINELHVHSRFQMQIRRIQFSTVTLVIKANETHYNLS